MSPADISFLAAILGGIGYLVAIAIIIAISVGLWKR